MLCSIVCVHVCLVRIICSVHTYTCVYIIQMSVDYILLMLFVLQCGRCQWRG